MQDKEIIEYGIASGENHFQLAQIVNEQLIAGWQPFNNVFEYQYGESRLLCQAMVKYKTAKKKA